MNRYITRKPDEPVQISDRVHLFEREDIDAINSAIAAKRPLLVRGEPGTGKTQLAEAAAVALGKPLVPKTVDARTESRDLLFEIDFVLRLAEAQLRGSLGGDRSALLHELSLVNFVRPGVLWWAFDWAGADGKALKVKPPTPKNWTSDLGCVVLIDEIDKAEPDLPNGLLESLGHGRFAGPTGEIVELKQEHPLVVITTNEERELPDAFVRRCFVHYLRLPSAEGDFVDFVSTRGRRHFPSLADSILRDAAAQLFADRSSRKQGDARPGLAEYLDVLRVLASVDYPEKDAKVLLSKLRRFSFQKYSAGAGLSPGATE